MGVDVSDMFASESFQFGQVSKNNEGLTQRIIFLSKAVSIFTEKFNVLFIKDLFQTILFLFNSCNCQLGVLRNDGRSCNYTGVLYYLSDNAAVFIDTRYNLGAQFVNLPFNWTVSAVTYDVQKRRLFYADIGSKNSKIAVIFPGNGTWHEIYLAGKYKKLFLNPIQDGHFRGNKISYNKET